MVAADVHRDVPAVWPAAVSLFAHAPAKRHAAGTAGFPRQGTLAGVSGDQRCLTEYLARITDTVIREEVYKETGDAEEVEEPAKIER